MIINNLIPQEAKPFIAAYWALKCLQEQGCVDVSLYINLEGACSLIMGAEAFREEKNKELAESIFLSKKWYPDAFGNFCLGSKAGLVCEEEVKYEDLSEEEQKKIEN